MQQSKLSKSTSAMFLPIIKILSDLTVTVNILLLSFLNDNCVNGIIIIIIINYYIVTCQPFVGLRNGVSRHRPVNKVPRRRDDVTCAYVVARRRAAILSDCKGSERRDVRVLLNNTMTVGRRPLTQLGYISEAISRFTSVPGVTVKKSVFRKQLYEIVRKEQSYESVAK
jgi:hypothetical protein